MPENRVCEEYQLIVPAHEESLLSVRLTTAGVLALCRIDVDTADLFKHAVSEACYALMHQKNTAERVSVLFRMEEEALRVTCALQTPVLYTEERIAEPSVCACILETMADKVEIDFDSDCMRAIHLSAFYL